jgi:hypothetical protein
MSAKPTFRADGEALPEPMVDKVLAVYAGDHRAAIEALLADRAYLERELAFASLAMSFGFARGWRPAAGEREP